MCAHASHMVSVQKFYPLIISCKDASMNIFDHEISCLMVLNLRKMFILKFFVVDILFHDFTCISKIKKWTVLVS